MVMPMSGVILAVVLLINNVSWRPKGIPVAPFERKIWPFRVCCDIPSPEVSGV